jgi:hypothetical protein
MGKRKTTDGVLGAVGKKHYDDLLKALGTDVQERDYGLVEMAAKLYELFCSTAANGVCADKAVQLYLQIMQAFGATPKARLKISSSENKAEEEEAAWVSDYTK